MSFRLVPNSVTMDDLERRNSPNRCVISPNSVASGADYVSACLKIHQYFLQRKCRPKNLAFNYISFSNIGRGSHPARGLKLGTPLP